MKTVNDSKAAKEQADAEAAAAAQAEASTSQSSGGSYGYTGGGNGYSNYGYNNGGYTGGGSTGSDGGIPSGTPYTTDNPQGSHQFWLDLNAGKNCHFEFQLGDDNFNDNPMVCE